LDVSDLSVSSEFVDSISNLSVLSIVKEVFKNLKDCTSLVEINYFSETFNLVQISPSLEGITKVSIQVLEQFNEGLFFNLIILAIKESIISNRLDGEIYV